MYYRKLITTNEPGHSISYKIGHSISYKIASHSVVGSHKFKASSGGQQSAQADLSRSWAHLFSYKIAWSAQIRVCSSYLYILLFKKM